MSHLLYPPQVNDTLVFVSCVVILLESLLFRELGLGLTVLINAFATSRDGKVMLPTIVKSRQFTISVLGLKPVIHQCVVAGRMNSRLRGL